MFLDDELLQICKDAELTEFKQIQQLNVELCKKCEDYYKSKIFPHSSPKDVKIILDRTFNLFDSFVRLCKTSDDGTLKLLGKLFENHTFKQQFLKNDDMKQIYNKL